MRDARPLSQRSSDASLLFSHHFFVSPGLHGLKARRCRYCQNRSRPYFSRSSTQRRVGRDKRTRLLAAYRGHLEQVQRLIEEGADPNESAGEGAKSVTPLLAAVARDQVEVIEFLLANKARQDFSFNGRPIKDIALRSKNKTIRKLFGGK
jgi:Ankyrin repeats (3 copies)